MTHKNLKKVTTKGKTYYYHRPTGRRVKSEHGTDAFDREVEGLDVLARFTKKVTTLGDLCRAYLQGPEFNSQLAERTKIEYRKILHLVEPLYVMPLSALTSQFLLDLRDKMFKKHKRRTANYVLQVLSLIFSWGVPRAYAKVNPAIGVPHIKKPKGERKVNRPWSIQEFYTVLNAAEGGMKIAIGLGGYAGVSEGDALCLTGSNVRRLNVVEGDKHGFTCVLEYVRKKTGVPVSLPMHPELVEILANCKEGHLVQSRFKRPYTEDGFRSTFFKLVRKLAAEKKIGEGLTFHGLRHFVATVVANQGGDARVIMSMLGQKTMQMASHYSEQYDRGDRAMEGSRLLGSKLRRAEGK